MLFQMLTGVLPFRGDSMAELMYKIANEEAPDLRTIRAELPESLANLVALAMAKRPETRYQDGDQFAADLRSVLAEMGGNGGGSAGGAASATGRMPVAGSTGGHEKTAVLGTAAVAASDTFEKTAVHHTQATRPADDRFEKTAVHQSPHAASSSDAFEKTVVHHTQAKKPADDTFEKTAVHQQPRRDDKPGPAAGPTVPDVEI